MTTREVNAERADHCYGGSSDFILMIRPPFHGHPHTIAAGKTHWLNFRDGKRQADHESSETQPLAPAASALAPAQIYKSLLAIAEPKSA